MGTTPNFGTVTPLNGNALTAAYGVQGGTGWISPAIDVSRFEAIDLELVTATPGAATVVDIQPRHAARDLTNENDALPYLKPDDTDNLLPRELHLDPVANPGGFMSYDVRGVSQLVLVAKTDAPGTITLDVRYAGYDERGGGGQSAPDVA